MNAFLALTRQQVRAGLRNRTALFFTLGLAVLFMVLFGTIFGGSSSVNLKIGVVDGDHSGASHDFIHSLSSVGGITVTTSDLATGEDDLRHDRASIIVVIPAGFADSAHGRGHGPATLALYQSSTASQTAGIAVTIVARVAAQVGPQQRPAVTLGKPQTLSVNDVRVIDYFLPAMIAYIVLQTGINYVAIGLVDLRARRVLRRYRATPLTKAQILGAQVTAGALTVLMQIVVLVLVGTLGFGARMYGNWLVAAVPIVVGTLAFVGIGFLLTSAARTSEAARGIASAIAFPMMFLSGIFIPLAQLPPWMQTGVHVLPLTWLSDALHQVFNDGAGLGPIMSDILVLAGWAVVAFALAAWRFRWD